MKKHLVLLFLFGMVSGCGSGESSMSPTQPTPPPTLRGMVSFAFDDGRRSAYDNAIPALDSAGFKSTNFIITGRLNVSGDYIGVAEILSLQSRGHEIGAHSRSHTDLVLMSSEQMRNEVFGSKNDLLNVGIRSVSIFSYPFGSYNASIIQAVKDAGYIGARSSNGGYNTRTTDRYILVRQNLGSSVNIEQVRGWLDTAIRDDSWLIIVAHNVNQTVTEFSVTPDFFKQVVSSVKDKGIRVVTISEGIKLM